MTHGLSLNTVPLPLWHAAARRPHATAVIDGDSGWTYAELAGLAEGVADQLAQGGAGRGDRIAVLASPSISFIALVHAAMRRGIVICPLNTRLARPEIEALVRRLDPCLVIAEEAHRALAPARAGQAISLEALSAANPAKKRARRAVPFAGDSAAAREFVSADTEQAILFSSGTTNAPKGVVLTTGNFFASALASGLRLGVLPDDAWLTALPFYHVGGLSIVLRSAVYGTAVRIMAHFDETAVLRSLIEGSVSHVSLVPTMLRRLLRAWEGAGRPSIHRRVRVMLLGGAAVDPQLRADASQAGWPLVHTYGLTETASQVATEFPTSVAQDDAFGQAEPTPRRDEPLPGAAPLPFVDVRVVDHNGRDVPTGGTGEIWVRGPVVMAGYWRDPAATAASLAGGWLHTGDAGRLHADGTLAVEDRRDDLIISGGENVSPREVEAALSSHPDVDACCVVGEADPEWGACVVAVVVPRLDHMEVRGRQQALNALSSALHAHVAATLARFKQPRRIVWADALPHTANGKVRRGVVRDWVRHGAVGELSAWTGRRGALDVDSQRGNGEWV